MTKVWLFDIDGTMIHSGGSGENAAVKTVAALFGKSESHGDTKFAGRTDRAIMWDIFAHHQIDSSEENWQRFQVAYTNELRSQLQTRPGGVFPGVKELLDALRFASDIPLGLLTGNVKTAADIKLQHFGLDHHFSFGGFGDDHADRNDVAKAAHEKAEEVLGEKVSPDRIWVVGDTPNDVRCARSIGANVIAVATGGSTREELGDSKPDVLVDDLTDQKVWKLVG